ncbi:MAG: hypothetical protein JNL55_21875, partial [Steroidobacter sp.]|nr:hypothetical protein [Steroidobacter sp.]
MRRRLRRWIAVALTAVASCAMAQGASATSNAPFHFDESAGPYATGFKVVEQYDYTRSFSKAQPGRPLQTLVWYPAESNRASMTVGDYVALLATETTFGKPTEPSAEAKELLAGLNPVLGERLRAVRDAPSASGRVPVVIYSPGFSSVAWENAD